MLFSVVSLCPAADGTNQPGVHEITQGGWKARHSDEVKVTTHKASGSSPDWVRLEYSRGSKDWIVVDGPIVHLGARSNTFKNRRCLLSLLARTKGLDGYAMQIRLRQRSSRETEGGTFTRSLAPNLEWDAALEMDKAQNHKTWTALKGTSTIEPATESLAVEIWLKPLAGDGPFTIDLRDVKLTEMGEIEHAIRSTPPIDGNLFFGDSGKMKVDFVEPENITACRVELFDEANMPAGDVGAGAGTATLSIPLKNKGFYRVNATASYRDGRTITASTTAAVLGEPLGPEIRKSSRFGSMRVWGGDSLWLKSGSNWDWGIGGINLADYVLKSDGTVDPPPGLAPLIEPTDRKVIMTVGDFPRWVMPEGYSKGELMAPKDWGLFEKLFEAFAKQNPDLKSFCPYNEPDAHWRGSQEDFVKFHQVIAAGVKKGNPAMKVTGPGNYSIRMDDFKKSAALGLLDAFDEIVMHAYVDGTAPEREFIQNMTDLLAFLNEKGLGAKPVHVTEFGWNEEIGDWQKTITELERSRYAPRAISLLAAQPIDSILYFCFKFTSVPGKPGYSMLYMDNTPTPTFVAYVNVLKWLSWTKKNDGRWFSFSPRVHLTLFCDSSRNVAVAWTAEGTAPIFLPTAPTKVEDSMGRAVVPVKTTDWMVGPAPTFFELDNSIDLLQAKTLVPITAAPGTKIQLPWTPDFATKEFTLEGNTAEISAGAVFGNYSILGRSNGRYEVQPVRVLEPFTLKSLDYRLSPDGKNLKVIAEIISQVKKGSEVIMALELENGSRKESKQQLRAEGPNIVQLDFPDFELGKRYLGKVKLSATGTAPFLIEKPLDQTYLVCPIIKQATSNPLPWSTVPEKDFTDWAPFPGKVSREDCSARMKAMMTSDAFHLKVMVTDNEHYQEQDPAGMWDEDSIQIAFDIDANKEWQPNNVGNGYNGHRVVEYGVGLSTGRDKTMVWRSRAFAPGLASGCEEPRIVANVKREEKTTVYEVTFPWAVLGGSGPPEPGTDIGFALAVNDKDGGADKRHGLTLFKGIIQDKNPEFFGKLHVVAEGDKE